MLRPIEALEECIHRYWDRMFLLLRAVPEPLGAVMWRRPEVVVTATSRGGEGSPSSDTGAWTLEYLDRKSESSACETSIDVPGCKDQMIIGGRRTCDSTA
jgi:hypothetical protein